MSTTGRPTSAVTPGDFAVVSTGSWDGTLIEAGERVASRGRPGRWSHAVIATRRDGPALMIVEAEPDGAVEVAWHYEDRPFLWSTGILETCPGAADRALGMTGTPYSWLDYWAIALHSLHIPAPGLRDYIAASGHLICSQLVDRARMLAGSHLFSDARWPGYVMPSDLGECLRA